MRLFLLMSVKKVKLNRDSMLLKGRKIYNYLLATYPFILKGEGKVEKYK